ncbi:MAG: DUF2723 domain-containing protein [Planctomycetota bacterium]
MSTAEGTAPVGSSRSDPAGDRLGRAAPWLAAAVPFACYLVTAPRQVLFGDGIELAAVCATLGVAHPTGYPTFTMLGHLATWLPVGTPYFRVTLLCALCVSLACLLLYRMFLRLAAPAGGAGRPAVLGALAGALWFGLARPAWQHATMVEVYALSLLLTLGCAELLWRLVQRPSLPRLLLLGAAVGLSLTHHMLALASAPMAAIGVVVAARARPGEHPAGERSLGARLARAAGAAVGGGLAGLAPLLYLPIRARQDPALNWGDPASFERVLWLLRGGDFAGQRLLMAAPGQPFTFDTFLAHLGARVGELVRYLGDPIGGVPGCAAFGARRAAAIAAGQPEPVVTTGLQTALALPVVVLVLVGAVVAARSWFRPERRPIGLALLAALLLHLVAVLVYNIPDIHEYQLGLAGLLWLFAWPGLLRLAGVLADRRGTIEPVRGRWRLAAVGGAAALGAINLWAMDRSADDAAAGYVRSAFAALPENAVLLTSGDNDLFLCWYAQQVQRERPDVLVFGANFVRVPWYVASFADRDLGPHRVLPIDPTTVGYAAAPDVLIRHVIEPNLGASRVFTTLKIPELERRYRLQSTALLIQPTEYYAALARGEFPPVPILYELRRP